MTKEELQALQYSAEKVKLSTHSIYNDFIQDTLRRKLPCILPFYLEPSKENYEEYQKAFALQGLYLKEVSCDYREGVEYRLDYFERDEKWKANNEKVYTLSEIRKYLESQDSLGDIHYNLDRIDEILEKQK